MKTVEEQELRRLEHLIKCDVSYPHERKRYYELRRKLLGF